MTVPRPLIGSCILVFAVGGWASSRPPEKDSGSKATKSAPPFEETVILRGSLENSRMRFEREGEGHVAFLGGSITEMEGYRPLVMELLKRCFAQTDFRFTNAGIASTCSTTGAFRLATDVLQKGPVDLLFVEFGVNDDQDAAHDRRECIRGMEGIVRQVRRHNPRSDVVFIHFVNSPILEALKKGKTPVSIAGHEAVARHDSIPTVHLALEVARQITSGKLTWEEYGGTHPGPAGNELCARMIDALLARAWKKPLEEEAVLMPHLIPDDLLDEKSYASGHFVDPRRAVADTAWTLGIPDWPRLPGAKRDRFSRKPLLCAEQPGAELRLEFVGTAVGAYVLARPDAGILRARVDQGAFHDVDLYHRFSRGLHYPRTVMFAADLTPGRHSLLLRVAAGTSSKGHAARVLQFAVNGPKRASARD